MIKLSRVEIMRNTVSTTQTLIFYSLIDTKGITNMILEEVTKILVPNLPTEK
jgi:hypothetical protein